MPVRRILPSVWLWSTPESATALRSRDLATILRLYRRLNALNQEQLATLLGYDKTYVSMIETGRRVINDMTTRRHIATTLGLPAHVLGVTGHADADFTGTCVLTAEAESSSALWLTGLRLVADLPDAGGPEDGGTVTLEQHDVETDGVLRPAGESSSRFANDLVVTLGVTSTNPKAWSAGWRAVR